MVFESETSPSHHLNIFVCMTLLLTETIKQTGAKEPLAVKRTCYHFMQINCHM